MKLETPEEMAERLLPTEEHDEIDRAAARAAIRADREHIAMVLEHYATEGPPAALAGHPANVPLVVRAGAAAFKAAAGFIKGSQ